jgi:hypothetical protein
MDKAQKNNFTHYNIINIELKTTVFWDVAPCILVETDQHFRGAYYLRHQGYETSVNFYQTTTVIYMLAVVRTWNLTNIELFFANLKYVQ